MKKLLFLLLVIPFLISASPLQQKHLAVIAAMNGYGPNLIANPTFDSGTPAMTSNGTNTVVNDSGVIKITYVDATAPRFYLETAGGNLSSAMENGKDYLLEMDVRVGSGSVVLTVDAGMSSAPANYTVDWTSMQRKQFVVTCQNYLDDYWYFSDFFTGEIFYFDNLSLREIK